MSFIIVQGIKNFVPGISGGNLACAWDMIPAQANVTHKVHIRFRSIDGEWSNKFVIDGDVETTCNFGVTAILGKLYEFEVQVLNVSAASTERSAKAYFGYIVPSGVSAPANFHFIGYGFTSAVLGWNNSGTNDYAVIWTKDGKRRDRELAILKNQSASEVALLVDNLEPASNYRFYLVKRVLNENIYASDYLEKLSDTIFQATGADSTTTTTIPPDA